MSQTYPKRIYTQFPDEISVREYVQDLSISTKVYYDQYCSYIQTGNFTAANEIKETYLKNVLLDAFFFNGLIDDILSLQQLFHDDIESWIFNISEYVGTFSSAKKYTKFNVVSYAFEGAIQFYQAIKLEIPIGTLPTNENYWICTTLRGQKGDPGTGMAYGGIWDELTEYTIDQFVVCDNAFWICVVENSNSRPSKSNGNWELMIEISANLFVYDNSNSLLMSTTMQDAITELDGNMRLYHTCTLLKSGWSNTAPYTQTVLVDGITVNDNPSLFKKIASDATPEEVKEYKKVFDMIDCGETGNGTVAFICYNKKPTIDFTVGLKGV